MSDLPNDTESPPESKETAPPEKLSPGGRAAMQGEDDAYRRVLEKQIEAQTARLPDYQDDPENQAALEADIRDANQRLYRDVQQKHGIEPEAEPETTTPAAPSPAPKETLTTLIPEPPDPAADNPPPEQPPAFKPGYHAETPASPETETLNEKPTREAPLRVKPIPPEGWTPGGPETR